MSMALALMMFSVALSLRSVHFAAIRQTPRAYFTGVVMQLLGLPALSLALVYWLNPIPSVALGMLVVACCPGGNVSNMLVLLAKGNTALSVALTATSSLAAALITPISILFWSGLYPPTAQLLTEINFDALQFLLHSSVILVLPLLLGMALLKYQPALVSRIAKPLVWLSSVALSSIIVVACVRYWDMFLLLGSLIMGVVAIHNASAFLLGYLSARLAGVGQAEQKSLTIEVGIQNSGLAIVILLSQMSNLGGTVAVAALWGVWHILAGLVVVLFFRARKFLRPSNDSILR